MSQWVVTLAATRVVGTVLAAGAPVAFVLTNAAAIASVGPTPVAAIAAQETFTAAVASVGPSPSSAIAAQESFVAAVGSTGTAPASSIAAAETIGGTVSSAGAVPASTIAAKETIVASVASVGATPTAAIAAAIATPLGLFGAALVLDLDSRFSTNNGTTQATALQDQSGSGNNCAGTVGWSASGVNGLPKLTLSGAQSMVSSTSVVASGVARTVYAVLTPSASSAILGVLTFRKATPYCSCLATQAAGGGYITSDGTAHTSQVTANPTSGIHMYRWQFPSFAGVLPIYAVDEVAKTVVGLVSVSDTGTAGYQVFSNASAQGWVGDGYRIVVVNRLTTGAEDAAVHAMFQSLYGVT